jgi:hypothetical protein
MKSKRSLNNISKNNERKKREREGGGERGLCPSLEPIL